MELALSRAPPWLELHSSHGTGEWAIRGQGTAPLFLAPMKLLPVGGGRPGPGQGRGEGCGPVGPWGSGPSSPWSRDPRQAPQMVSSVAK